MNIYDIAKEAGVSIATVSRVINNKGTVSDATRAKVEAVLSRSGYTPSAIARGMVTKYGMSELLGPILYGHDSGSDEVFLGRDFNNTRNYSEQTASDIDTEIKRIISEGYAAAEKILKEQMEKLHFIAGFLMKNEIMEEDQFNRAMDATDEAPVTYEELEEMVAEKRRRSAEENEKRAQHLAEQERKREEERRRREEQQAQDERPPEVKY